MPPRKKKTGDSPVTLLQTPPSVAASGWKEGDWLCLSRDGHPPVPGKVSQIRDQDGEIWLTYVPHLWHVEAGAWAPYVGTAWQAKSDNPQIRKIAEPKGQDDPMVPFATALDAASVQTPVGQDESAQFYPPPLPAPPAASTPIQTPSPVPVLEARIESSEEHHSASERALSISIGHLTQDAEYQLSLVKLTAAELTELARSLALRSDDDLEPANELGRKIKAAAAKSETIRKRFTIPLDSAKKAIQAIFQPTTKALETALKELDGKIVDFRKRRQLEQAAAARAQQNAFASMSFEEAMRQADTLEDPEEARRFRAAALDRRSQFAVAPAYVAPMPKADGMTVRRLPDFEILDIRAVAAAVAAGSLPTYVLEVARGPVLDIIRAGVAEIPGLRVFWKESVVHQ